MTLLKLAKYNLSGKKWFGQPKETAIVTAVLSLTVIYILGKNSNDMTSYHLM